MVAGLTTLHLKDKDGQSTVTVTALHFRILPSLPRLTSCSPSPSDFPPGKTSRLMLGLVLCILEEQVQCSSAWSHQDSRAELGLRIRGGNWQDQTPGQSQPTLTCQGGQDQQAQKELLESRCQRWATALTCATFRARSQCDSQGPRGRACEERTQGLHWTTGI